VILHDASLADLCIQRPRSPEELLDIHGIGPGKAERYGEDLLAAIREFEAMVKP
jgi:ATP-dependent DNA helicase RecQ